MEKIKLQVWDKEYTLNVVFDCYEDEVVTKEQNSALSLFLSHPEWIEISMDKVVSFCQKRVLDLYGEKITGDLLDYVNPKEIYIKRDKVNPRVALMCDFRYDPEHGIAIVFTSEGKTTIGIQDIII